MNVSAGKAILEVSQMVEITHAFLLMHDDVIDKDPIRRGSPTVHIQYRNFHKKRYTKGDSGHYGNCMAINLGDAGFALSHLLLAASEFSSETKIKVLKRFNEIILNTIFGQGLDVSYENLSQITEEEVMQVHHYKSADYTITGPLQYGALFAGANEKEIDIIEKYGLPVGIAFQLRDDELGIYSEEEKLGKPVGSDIRENKNTLLHIKVLEWAGPKDKKFLESAYGNHNLTRGEVKRVKEITVKTGALAYSQKLSRQLVEKGKKFIPQITKDKQCQDTLYKMADFMIERDS